MYNVYVKVIETNPSGFVFLEVDKIRVIANNVNPYLASISAIGCGYKASIKPIDIIYSIGQAKKLSEQNDVSVILDLTGQVPKIEKL